MKQMRCKKLSGYGRSPPTFVQSEQKLRCKESKKKENDTKHISEDHNDFRNKVLWSFFVGR